MNTRLAKAIARVHLSGRYDFNAHGPLVNVIVGTPLLLLALMLGALALAGIITFALVIRAVDPTATTAREQSEILRAMPGARDHDR